MRTRQLERFGPWAVVTGASSGIGAEFARQLAAAGLSVVLVARRRGRLEQLAGELERDFGVSTRILVRDLGDAAAARSVAADTSDLDVGILVNNAGLTSKGAMLDHSLDLQESIVRLNCVGVLVLAHGFGERFRTRGGGAMIIVASTSAYQAVPFAAVYGASKAFDLHLGEALRIELAPHGVEVLTLCPGGTDTEGPKRTGVQADRVPGGLMAPEIVARVTLESLGRRGVIIPGTLNQIGYLAGRLMPRPVAAWFSGRMMKRVTRY